MQKKEVANGCGYADIEDWSKEYLIERYKDLVEIEKEHKKENGELRERVEELEKCENYYKNVRKKIEEYNKMINATYGDITYHGDIRRDNCIEIRNVLQELLEEGDKQI